MADDKRLERIEKKLDDSSEQLNEINVTLGKQHVAIEEHIRRTNLLESKLEPVEKHVAMVNGALKLIGLLSIIIGMIAGIIEIAKLAK